GLLIRDRPAPSIVTNPETTTTTLTQETTTAVTATTTTVAVGPLLSAPPSEPHIQLGLNDVTLTLSLAGDLIGHVQPPLVGPEFYQRRQRRLTAEVGGNVSIQEDCLVDSVIEPDRTWWVTCDPEAESGPYIGVLAADGGVTVMGRLPNPPAGASVFGHWQEVFVRQDGALLAQFSGECEVPHAMFIVDGVARHLSGEGFWDDAPVPNSFAYGWLPDGKALVWTWHQAGCGSSDPKPGLYAYDIDGSRELLYPIRDFPIWGRIVQQR
ncbi:MAG TPA: hypothetical protein VFT54_08710, partial [Acidimicrobiia bacterium]|nr:hypothetical protein [Acidimicrobiia bacterium]